MTDAPKVKHLTPTGGIPTGNWPQEELVPYIRSDLVAKKDAALLAAEELAKALEHEHDRALYLTSVPEGHRFRSAAERNWVVAQSDVLEALTAFRAAMEDTQ